MLEKFVWLLLKNFGSWNLTVQMFTWTSLRKSSSKTVTLRKKTLLHAVFLFLGCSHMYYFNFTKSMWWSSLLVEFSELLSCLVVLKIRLHSQHKSSLSYLQYCSSISFTATSAGRCNQRELNNFLGADDSEKRCILHKSIYTWNYIFQCVNCILRLSNFLPGITTESGLVVSIYKCLLMIIWQKFFLVKFFDLVCPNGRAEDC